jgi:GDP-L-fucose synthase
MQQNSRIYIAGHRGMVGSAIERNLRNAGYHNLLLKSSSELDLRNQEAVSSFFRTEKPEFVFLAAAKVGGIVANNTYRAQFLYDNLMIEANIIHAAYENQCEKLLFLGSSCIYPKFAPQPMDEGQLLTGILEPTNEPYAIAKIAGIKLCEAYRDQYGCNFISAMPTNLYGPNDNYDLQNSHVLPALIRKFHDAKLNHAEEVEVWGSGSPMREFLHVDDLAEACVFLMKTYNEKQFVNIGTGEDLSIRELVLMVQQISAYQGKVVWNTSRPDGTPRKLMNVAKIHALGWKHKIKLEEGIKSTYNAYSAQSDRV